MTSWAVMVERLTAQKIAQGENFMSAFALLEPTTPALLGPTTPSSELRAAHGQCCPSGRPLGGELLAVKGGPLDVLESCSSPISAVGMGLSP